MNEEIREVMAKSFEVSPDKISESTNQDTLENWDSLHHMKLIIGLERKFNITIPDNKVGNMISYKTIESVVNDCLHS